MMNAENKNNSEQLAEDPTEKSADQQSGEAAEDKDKNKPAPSPAGAPGQDDKRASDSARRPEQSPEEPRLGVGSKPNNPDNRQRSFFADNAVIIALLGVAVLVAAISWQIEGRPGSKTGSDPGRQGVSQQSATGMRGAWYYSAEARFRPGADAEVSESPGVIDIRRRGTSGLITIENIDLDDRLPEIASQPGNQKLGSAVIYPTPAGQGRAVAFVGTKRWELYFQGPESAKLLRQIVTSAEPR